MKDPIQKALPLALALEFACGGAAADFGRIRKASTAICVSAPARPPAACAARKAAMA